MKTQIEILAETIISMSSDFLLGKISKELYMSNLNSMANFKESENYIVENDKLNTKCIISYEKEYYTNGSNLLFSISFPNHIKDDYIPATGGYNDNHEFGDDEQVKISAKKLANWYLEDESRINLIDSGYHDPKWIAYKDDLRDFISTLLV
jgi:hypothetical protein